MHFEQEFKQLTQSIWQYCTNGNRITTIHPAHCLASNLNAYSCIKSNAIHPHSCFKYRQRVECQLQFRTAVQYINSNSVKATHYSMLSKLFLEFSRLVCHAERMKRIEQQRKIVWEREEKKKGGGVEKQG